MWGRRQLHGRSHSQAGMHTHTHTRARSVPMCVHSTRVSNTPAPTHRCTGDRACTRRQCLALQRAEPQRSKRLCRGRHTSLTPRQPHGPAEGGSDARLGPRLLRLATKGTDPNQGLGGYTGPGGSQGSDLAMLGTRESQGSELAIRTICQKASGGLGRIAGAGQSGTVTTRQADGSWT